MPHARRSPSFSAQKDRVDDPRRLTAGRPKGPTGNPITAWGTHGSNTDQLLRPYGVDADQNDNVYVADSDNNRIQEFTSTGLYQKTFGQPGTGSGDFRQLRRVAVGSGPDPDVTPPGMFRSAPRARR